MYVPPAFDGNGNPPFPTHRSMNYDDYNNDYNIVAMESLRVQAWPCDSASSVADFNVN